MRIATWNLQRPRPTQIGRLERIREWVDRVDADVWVLTETHDIIVPSGGYAAVSSEGADRPQLDGERWVTIWSRFPLEGIPTSDPIRTVAARILAPDGAFIVCGVVLPWLGSKWRGIPSADGRAFEAALDVYESDWLSLRRSHPGDDFIVAGDFNQDLAPRHYYGSRRNHRRLEAALSETRLCSLTAGMSDPIFRESSPRACIDHICASGQSIRMRGQAHRWPDLAKPDPSLSDHFGVYVDLV